jgi:hypothetical protein
MTAAAVDFLERRVDEHDETLRAISDTLVDVREAVDRLDRRTANGVKVAGARRASRPRVR